MLASLHRSFARPSLLVETAWVRLLGLTYLAAFASMLPQITALIGATGIAPAANWMLQLHTGIGNRAYFELPSVFWLNACNNALVAVCWLGCVAAAVLTSGFFTRTAAGICWLLYLSITVTGQPFTNFQWDSLLLEAGFLALFSGAPLLVWAYRFLLFRLMFESGIVKLTSHDANWRNFHALRFHFLTQPLPTPVAYYASRLPGQLLDTATVAMFFIELVCPFFLFAPRRLRLPAVSLLVFFQLLIAFTGNYAFFNFLTISLCVWGLEDSDLARFSRWLRPVRRGLQHPKLLQAASTGIALLMIFAVLQIASVVSPQKGLADLIPDIIGRAEIVNNYGLFAVMTTSRPELVIEGSNDETTWKEYTFRFKPGPLDRGLPTVAPYQPRLDWQMWFAALGNFQENSWLGGLLYRLLTGDRGVLQLLEPPPFATPPRSLRVLIYEYRFTTPEEHARTGRIWQRQLLGTWYGPVALRPKSG